MSDILESLSGMEKENYYQRLTQGIVCISKLIDQIQVQIINRKDEDAYLTFLSPEEIIYNTESYQHHFSLPSSSYKEKQILLDDIRHDYLHTKIDKNISKFFIPGYFYFLRRSILLFSDDQSANKYKYKFLDVSPYGNNIENEDFLVLKSSSNENDNILLKIDNFDIKSRSFLLNFSNGCENIHGENHDMNAIDNDNSIIEKKPHSTPKDVLKDVIEKKSPIVYYQNINPGKYYFEMLGKFFYQAFLAGIGNEDNLQPVFSNILDSILSSITQDKCQEIEFKLPKLTQKKKKQKDLVDLIGRLLKLYILLSKSPLKNSFYNDFEARKHDESLNDDKSIFNTLNSEIDELKTAIAEFISSKQHRITVKKQDIDLVDPSMENEEVKKRLNLTNPDYLQELGELCRDLFNTIDINEIYRESIIHNPKITKLWKAPIAELSHRKLCNW
ncbi:hypothetical protein [Coleofasciculus sp. E1-EBD-02]|uniref:hypothetical protein n=1 Tax=Coleofasciculus sp. E1-EBD-02 TaxID=3068481 RepID=UPI0032F26272